MSWWSRFRRLAEQVRQRRTGHPPRDDTVAVRAASRSPQQPRSSKAASPLPTQFHGSTGEVTDLVVGLDFGTSCTKAVVRSPFAFRSRATAVRWRGGNADGSYLLPTVLYETGVGFALECSGVVRNTHDTLKIDLMNNPASRETRARAAAYLGLALQATRQWFFDSEHDVYKRFRLRWALNLGIPSAGYDDGRVREAFCAVARAAWRLSLRPDRPTLSEAVGAFTDAERGMDSLEQVAVVPEIAAEVVGYARSKHRREGLHVMVDVGASTIDICGFVLHPADGEDGDQYHLLTALVKRLGLHELHLRRTCAVEAAGERLCPVVAAAPSPFGAIPDAGRSYVDDPARRLRGQLDRIDEEYTEECTNAIMTVLMDLRRRRDPHSTNWESGLPVFVGGGGGRFKLVTDMLSRSHERLVSAVETRGIKRMGLPALHTLSNSDIPEEMAGRLDGAYGLSFDSLDIGEIHPPHKIADVPPMPERPRRETVGKEQV